MFDFLIKAGLIIFVGIPLAFIAFWVVMMIIGIPVRIYYAIEDLLEERNQKKNEKRSKKKK